MEKAKPKLTITGDLAQKLIGAAAAKAKEIGVALAIAVLDEGANLKAFYRMDGAALLASQIAQNKAFTALFGFPTHEFFNFIKTDPSLLAGIPNVPNVAAYGGGYPIRVDGQVVGAIGTSGGTVEQDMICAQAALEGV